MPFFPDFVASDINTDPLYYFQSTPNSIWPSRIYQTNRGISSSSVCSAICTLVSGSCQLYVYISSSLTCYFGNFATVSAGIAAAAGSAEIVHTRISAIGLLFQDILINNSEGHSFMCDLQHKTFSYL